MHRFFEMQEKKEKKKILLTGLCVQDQTVLNVHEYLRRSFKGSEKNFYSLKNLSIFMNFGLLRFLCFCPQTQSQTLFNPFLYIGDKPKNIGR